MPRPAERAAEKPIRVLFQLADALAAHEEFWAQVDRVCEGEDARKVASAYGEGERRAEVIAALLRRAASESSSRRERQFQAMTRLAYYVPGPARRHIVILPSGEQLAVVGSGGTLVVNLPDGKKQRIAIPEDASGSRGTYTYRPDFLAVIRKGAVCIARRGAGRCLTCGARLSPPTRDVSWRGGGQTRPVRRNYCEDHEDEEYGPAHTTRIEAMRTVYDWAEQAILATD
jgi:hypothetical protein